MAKELEPLSAVLDLSLSVKRESQNTLIVNCSDNLQLAYRSAL
jgi:hypothetical protein